MTTTMKPLERLALALLFVSTVILFVAMAGIDSKRGALFDCALTLSERDGVELSAQTYPAYASVCSSLIK